MEVFGSSGVRGVANDDLTTGFVMDVAVAAGSFWNADRVAIGRDTRTTGPMFAAAAASGLASVGADVDRLGVVPTPGVQAYAEAEDVPAMVVTASHNPPEYNGLKLIGADGVELAIPDLERIEAAYLDGSTGPVGWREVGTIRPVEGVNRRYREDLLAAVDRDRLEAADLSVAIDPGHGAGALTSPRFFRDLGCGVVTVNAEPDGHFPGRDPEPVRDNLAALRRLVRASDADLGVAHDGDADRAIFVDEHGEAIEGDAALAALAAAELEAGDVAVSAVNVSQRLVDAVEAADARLELTPIGSSQILTRIRELEADGEHVPVAGEGNGGIIFPAYRRARDGAYTAARFLDRVVDEPASAVVAPYDDYHNVRANLAYDDAGERAVMLEAVERFAADSEAAVSTIDGYRLDFGDAWVLARPSGTEPLVRLYAEARDADRARSLVDEIEARIVDAAAEA